MAVAADPPGSSDSGSPNVALWTGIGLSVVGVIAMAVWAWVKVPDVYPVPNAPTDVVRAAQESARSAAIATTRASVLAAMAGLGALATILINYRNSQVAGRTLAITQRTFDIQARGHLTDRYTKAIEQLGNTHSNAIRLGGIYALEQIAVDTDRGSDQQTVVEVLSAFIREHAHTGPTSQQHERQGVWDPARDKLRRLTSDVAAALSVLGRLPRRPGIPRADLTDANFSHIDLFGVNLSGANLTYANLNGAYLNGADLAGADLAGADLTGANLFGAKFIDARLFGANLTGASLVFADLTGADLSNATLTDTRLRGDVFPPDANLTRAKLGGARGLRRDQLSDKQKRVAASLPSKLADS